MIFLVLSGKMIFLFPENMILPPRWKMKDDLSEKKYTEIFFQCSEKIVFSKRTALRHDLSCMIWKDSIFFPESMIFFLWTENETHGNVIFSVHTCRCYGRGSTSLCPKKPKMILSCKNTPKDDWHPRSKILERAPVILCTFTDTFTGVFIYCSPAKKPQETYYIGLKFDFFFNLFSWRYSAISNLQ